MAKLKMRLGFFVKPQNDGKWHNYNSHIEIIAKFSIRINKIGKLSFII